MRKILQLILVLSLGFWIPQIVGATPLTVDSSSGSLSASVTFSTTGNSLIVTLSNTSTSDVLVPTDVLTAVFFDSTGVPLTLSKTSAILPIGSSVLFGVTGPGGSVGGEWAYKSGLVGAPEGAQYGISSTGVNLFGPPNRFLTTPVSNLQGPTSPGGLEYGITSAGDLQATGNTPVTGQFALIKNSVVFTLGGLPDGFDPSTSIFNVSFLYGTDLASVPEPATMFLLGFGLIGAGVFARRRFKK